MERDRVIIEPLLAWMARNRMNYGGSPTKLPALAKKLGLRVRAGGDELHHRFKHDAELRKGVTLFDAHPDWFALRRGKRARVSGLICGSNKDAVDYFMDILMKLVMKDAAWLDEFLLGGSDSGRAWCECPNCLKKGNAPASEVASYSQMAPNRASERVLLVRLDKCDVLATYWAVDEG